MTARARTLDPRVLSEVAFHRVDSYSIDQALFLLTQRPNSSFLHQLSWPPLSLCPLTFMPTLNSPLPIPKQALEEPIIASPHASKHSSRDSNQPRWTLPILIVEQSPESEYSDDERVPHQHENKPAQPLSVCRDRVRLQRVEVLFILLRDPMLVRAVGDQLQVPRRRLRVLWVWAREPAAVFGGWCAWRRDGRKESVRFERRGGGVQGDF